MSPTVLIVDDHAAFRAGARALLEADGYHVVGEATTGSTGLRAARALRPDVVLLDVRLPDMDGFAVAEQLVASAREGADAGAGAGDRDGEGPPAIIVISSSDDPLYPALATGSGACGFVAKHDVCGAALDRLLA